MTQFSFLTFYFNVQIFVPVLKNYETYIISKVFVLIENNQTQNVHAFQQIKSSLLILILVIFSLIVSL